jgi:hypothetical protein
MPVFDPGLFGYDYKANARMAEEKKKVVDCRKCLGDFLSGSVAGSASSRLQVIG